MIAFTAPDAVVRSLPFTDISKISSFENVSADHRWTLTTEMALNSAGSKGILDEASSTNVTDSLAWNGAGGHMIQTSTFIPWDNPHNIISHKMEFLIVSINSAGLVPLLYLMGAPCNLLCIVVFYRLGLRDRINLCLFALAIVDLLTITMILLLSAEEAYRKLIGCSNFVIQYFVGLTGFTWASQFVSTVIACERCFCVVSPFKAQRYLKTSTMAVIIILVCFILVGGMCAVAGQKHTAICTYDPLTNTSRNELSVTEFYLENKRILDIFDVFIYATAFPIIFLTVIVVATAVTAVRLRHAAAWRLHISANSTNNNNDISDSNHLTLPPHCGTHARASSAISVKEVALTKMLIVTSIVFIICLTPNVMVQIATFLVEDLSYEGRYANLTSVLWNAISFFRMVNSSLNFFVYVKMGSRFREVLHKLTPCFGLNSHHNGHGITASSSSG